MRMELLVFLILLALVFLFHMTRGYQSKKTTVKKGKNDANGTEAERKEREEKTKKLRLVIFSMAGYVMLISAVYVVFPDFWTLWWGDQPLFWISVIGFLIGAGLLFLPGKLSYFGKPVGGLLILVLIIGIGRHITETFPEEETSATAVTASKPAKICSGLNERLVYPMIWSEVVKARFGYDWTWDKVKKGFSLDHYRSLVEVRANGNDNLVLEDGKLPDGTFAESHFPREITITSIQFKSMENYPVCMKVVFLKK